MPMQKDHRIAIIADDLTGACDTALQFHTAGRRAAVVVERAALSEVAADVVALDTDSRDAPPDEAYLRVAEALAAVKACGIGTIYKKLDSALRGNVGREVDALIEVAGAEVVLLTPAFPTLGRVVDNGTLHINDLPLMSTPFASSLPIASSQVIDIVAHSGRAARHHIDISVLNAGHEALERAVIQARDDGHRVVVLDATTDDHLHTVARVLDAHPDWQGAGSAGLGSALASALGQPGSVGRVESHVSASTRPILTIVGSIHPAARAQFDALVADRSITPVQMSIEHIAEKQESEIERIVTQLRGLLEAGTDVALTTDLEQQKNLDNALIGRAISAALGAVVAQIAPLLGGLVLTGGDTAMGVWRGLGARAAEVVGQVQPGVPALILQGGSRPGLPIVTKAGSFGSLETLVEARRFLRLQAGDSQEHCNL